MCNQRGIECTGCEKWTHASCAGVSILECERLGEETDEEWLCPGCLIATWNVPFAEVSLNSSTIRDKKC